MPNLIKAALPATDHVRRHVAFQAGMAQVVRPKG